MDQTYDYLIALDIVTTSSTRGSEKRRSTNEMVEETSDISGKIIYICWAAYDTRKNIVTDEHEYFVKPVMFTELSAETVEATQITNEEMKRVGVPLQDVIHRFNEALYLNYICNNTSFCIVTADDEKLASTLSRDAREVKVKLQNHFFSFFNITDELRKACGLTNNFANLDECLTFLLLKRTEARNLGQVQVKNISRLIHRLTKDGHVFQTPKVLNPSNRMVIDQTLIAGGQPQQNKKWSTFIRGKSPDKFRNPLKKWYVRLRGLPYDAREPEVMEFFRGVGIYKEDIVFLYDYEGKFTGESYCQLHNEADFREAISFHHSDLGNRYIEVFDTTENEYTRAKVSQFPEKREMRVEANPSWSNLVQEGMGFLKLRGLPYSCTEDDIRNFFKGYNIAKDGVKRAVSGGRPGGECFVIFESKADANAAMCLHKEKIGNRFIELFSSNVRELENYLHHNFSNSNAGYSKESMPNIPLEKRKSTLMMIGLPFNATKMEIYKFFNDFRLTDNDTHILLAPSGKPSGNALVTFDDEMEAQRALKSKKLSYIGTRFIELSEYR